MNHLINERGENIIAVGEDKSFARMATKYPDTILKLIERLKTPEPLLVKACRENDIPANDQYHLIQAAMYYHSNNLEPLK